MKIELHPKGYTYDQLKDVSFSNCTSCGAHVIWASHLTKILCVDAIAKDGPNGREYHKHTCPVGTERVEQPDNNRW
jgi:hypothetical protein